MPHDPHCPHHGDGDNLLRRYCSGRLKNGDKCSNRAVATSNEFLYLPVCGTHKRQAQQHKGATCVVSETCGHRCGRLCVEDASGGHNNLCYLHKSTALPCYLNRLPTELRFAIIELLIPSGPIPAAREADTESYAAVASLARVNKETNKYIDALVYKSASRPCQIKVDEGVEAMMQFYSNDPRCTGENGAVVRSKRTGGIVFDLSDLKLTNFAYYDIQSNGIIEHAVLLHVMFAIANVRSKPSPRTMQGPHINFTCAFGADVAERDMSIDRLDELFDVIRKILRIVSSFVVRLEWSVELQINQGLTTFTNFRLRKNWYELTGPALAATARTGLLKRCAALRLFGWAADPNYRAYAQLPKWQRYLRLVGIVRSLLEVGYFLEERYIRWHLYNIMTEAQLTFDAGRWGWTRDCLARLERRIDVEWQTFVSQQQDKVDELQSYFLQPTVDQDQSSSPGAILSKAVQSRGLEDLVRDHRADREEPPHWADAFWSSSTARPYDERYFDRWDLDASLNALKVYKKCAEAAARLVRSQTKLMLLSGNSIDQNVERTIAGRRREVRLMRNPVKQLMITDWIQARKTRSR